MALLDRIAASRKVEREPIRVAADPRPVDQPREPEWLRRARDRNVSPNGLAKDLTPAR